MLSRIVHTRHTTYKKPFHSTGLCSHGQNSSSKEEFCFSDAFFGASSCSLECGRLQLGQSRHEMGMKYRHFITHDLL